MTRDSIGKLHLQSIIKAVVLQFLHTVRLSGNIAVILEHGIIQLLLLFPCEGRCLRCERVEHHDSRQFVVIIVRKCHRGLSESESIQLLHMPHLSQHRPIAIGNKIKAP